MRIFKNWKKLKEFSKISGLPRLLIILYNDSRGDFYSWLDWEGPRYKVGDHVLFRHAEWVITKVHINPYTFSVLYNMELVSGYYAHHSTYYQSEEEITPCYGTYDYKPDQECEKDDI